MSTRGYFGFIYNNQAKLDYQRTDANLHNLGFDFIEKLDKLSITEMKTMFDEIRMVNPKGLISDKELKKWNFNEKRIAYLREEHNELSWNRFLFDREEVEFVFKEKMMLDHSTGIENPIFPYLFLANLDKEILEIYYRYNREGNHRYEKWGCMALVKLKDVINRKQRQRLHNWLDKRDKAFEKTFEDEKAKFEVLTFEANFNLDKTVCVSCTKKYGNPEYSFCPFCGSNLHKL